MAPPDASQSPSASPVLGSSPTKAPGVAGIKRPNQLLARYGGQYGPTGVAAGPKGPSDSPVSLANFMGGRAAGPRLGKLAGDGKSAPPEADLIHENRRVPMPGMVSGRDLASFLKERADVSGNRRSGGGSPASPVEAIIEKQNAAANSASSLPATPRALSPTKLTRFTGGDSAPATPLPVSTKPPRRTSGKRIHVLVSGSGSNLQSLIDATLLDPPPGLPVIENAQITFVLSNRKAAYGLTRAAESNPPIPTKVLSLKTWQNRNPGGTREQYDQVLARAVLDGPSPEGTGTPPRPRVPCTPSCR